MSRDPFKTCSRLDILEKRAAFAGIALGFDQIIQYACHGRAFWVWFENSILGDRFHWDLPEIQNHLYPIGHPRDHSIDQIRDSVHQRCRDIKRCPRQARRALAFASADGLSQPAPGRSETRGAGGRRGGGAGLVGNIWRTRLGRGHRIAPAQPGVPTSFQLILYSSDKPPDLGKEARRDGFLDPAPPVYDPVCPRPAVRGLSTRLFPKGLLDKGRLFRFRQSSLRHGSLGPRPFRSSEFVVGDREKTKCRARLIDRKCAYLSDEVPVFIGVPTSTVEGPTRGDLDGPLIKGPRLVTKKLQGTHAGIAWSAGTRIEQAFPLARTARPEASSVATGCHDGSRMGQARRLLART